PSSSWATLPPARSDPGTYTPRRYRVSMSDDAAEHPLRPYDAVLVQSFGGPEGPDEVLPFLRRVTAGRGVPDERLVEVGAHYDLVGGVSPLPALNRRLVADLVAELTARE